MNNGLSKIVRDGLWDNNPGLVQLLGLCPLLAVTGTLINGLGLGLATLLVMIASNVTVSLIRNLVRSEVRIAVYVLIIASYVTAVELAMQAYFYDLYNILGIFIPLIVTNCAIIGRAEAYASKTTPLNAATDGLFMGLGFTAVLVVLGGMRELVGMGTILAQAHIMFGEAARNITVQFSATHDVFLLAILPPGAFIGLGLMIAAKNVIDRRMAAKEGMSQAQVVNSPGQA